MTAVERLANRFLLGVGDEHVRRHDQVRLGEVLRRPERLSVQRCGLVSAAHVEVVGEHEPEPEQSGERAARGQGLAGRQLGQGPLERIGKGARTRRRTRRRRGGIGTGCKIGPNCRIGGAGSIGVVHVLGVLVKGPQGSAGMRLRQDEAHRKAARMGQV